MTPTEPEEVDEPDGAETHSSEGVEEQTEPDPEEE